MLSPSCRVPVLYLVARREDDGSAIQDIERVRKLLVPGMHEAQIAQAGPLGALTMTVREKSCI
jgi:hypothetical protein